LWGGQTVSRFGDGVISVAPPLLVLMVTRSATDLGVVVAARLVPTEILGRVSSVDRTFSLGLSPIGVAVAGAVSGAVGVRATIVGPGIVVSTVALVLLVSMGSITAIDRRASSREV
jgi:DHA3 family tetracycline resistance protein-like MFS transporter